MSDYLLRTTGHSPSPGHIRNHLGAAVRYLNELPGFVSASAGGDTPKYQKVNFNDGSLWLYDCVLIGGQRWQGKVDSDLIGMHGLKRGDDVEFDAQYVDSIGENPDIIDDIADDSTDPKPVPHPAYKRCGFKDLTKREFNRWTALYYVGKKPGGHALWYCECRCGNTKIVRGVLLVNGQSKSCGCLKKDSIQRRVKNIIGQKFGNLVVESYSHSNGNGAAWKCICGCGKKKTVLGGQLRNGSVKTCGDTRCKVEIR